MSIAVDSRTSGFRKWAQARRPTTAGEPPGADDAGDVTAGAAVARGASAQQLDAHRPWLVPGVGKL